MKSRHTAIIHIPFEIDRDLDADETADEIVRDIMARGFPEAYLEEVFDQPEMPNAEVLESHYEFVTYQSDNIEMGHGEPMQAHFTIRFDEPSGQCCVESCDILAWNQEKFFGIGAVGGEVMIDRVPDYSDIIADWIEKWRELFASEAEPSVLGAYLIIKQIVKNGKITDFGDAEEMNP